MLTSMVDTWTRRRWQPTAETARFDGLQPVTVVTGGSEGIGVELAREFAALGHPLLLVARNEAKLKQTAQELSQVLPVKVFTVSADLATAIGPSTIRRALLDLNGYCEVLVNNAAMGAAGPLGLAVRPGGLYDLPPWSRSPEW